MSDILFRDLEIHGFHRRKEKSHEDGGAHYFSSNVVIGASFYDHVMVFELKDTVEISYYRRNITISDEIDYSNNMEDKIHKAVGAMRAAASMLETKMNKIIGDEQ